MNRIRQNRARPLPAFPVGVRMLPVAETARRRAVECTIVDVLEEASFAEVVLPIVDYADPYASLVTPDRLRAAYRFTDRNGDLVAVRSDFTPMLARAFAPLLDGASLPLRLFYRGDVVRCEEPRLGVNREYFQIGAEIIGDRSVSADAAMISLVTRVLTACGVQSRLVIEDRSILPSLEGRARDDSPSSLELRALLDRIAEGDPDFDALAAIPDMRDGVVRLRTIIDAVEGVVPFVLSFERGDDGSYYTGLRFRFLAADRAIVVAAGGRYDDLYGSFGNSAPAVGFTITVDLLEAA